MHFLVWVIGNPVCELMEPFRTVEWDWYQIGGRWTGLLSTYDPHQDPENKDEDGDTKWPTEWKRHDDDCSTVETALKQRHRPGAYVTKDGWFIQRTWSSEERDYLVNETFDETLNTLLNSLPPQTPLTVVDCHN